MILSDRTIKKLVKEKVLIIEPYDEKLVGPSSIDLRLGNEFLVFERTRIDYIDPKTPIEKIMSKIIIPENGHFVIHPGEFIIATTLEYIKLPDNIAARIEGRSSIARLGIIVHSTGGFVDAGFSGQLTLEMSNLNTVPIRLYPGMRIAQIALMMQDNKSEQPYGMRKRSKYYQQKGPIPSKIHLDFLEDR
ncbi:MAG: dCTP deaminase [Candidatus Njordarchaeia archaeon]